MRCKGHLRAGREALVEKSVVWKLAEGCPGWGWHVCAGCSNHGTDHRGTEVTTLQSSQVITVPRNSVQLMGAGRTSTCRRRSLSLCSLLTSAGFLAWSVPAAWEWPEGSSLPPCCSLRRMNLVILASLWLSYQAGL